MSASLTAADHASVRADFLACFAELETLKNALLTSQDTVERHRLAKEMLATLVSSSRHTALLILAHAFILERFLHHSRSYGRIPVRRLGSR